MFKVTKANICKTAQAGFSLVELMVVVTIIGILAGIAVPKFQTFKARAMQTEAKSGLNGVYLSMQAYQANYGDYASYGPGDAVAASIGFSVAGNQAKYQYSVHSLAPAGAVAGYWAATASSIAPLTNKKYDVFRINTNKWSCSVYDAVAEKAATKVDTLTAAANTECPQTGDGSATLAAAANDKADLPN